MKLINNVEPIIQLLNSPHVGQNLEFENGGEISKGNIEHFAIIHLENPSAVTINDITTKKTKKKATAVEVEDEEVEEDVVNMSEEKTLQLIRKSRRISCSSTTILADDGWFLVPIYIGMEELRPVVCKKLPAKKGYKLIILNSSIGNVAGEFTKDNLKDWELNSIRKLNALFDNDPMGFSVKGVFVHKRDDFKTRMMRNAVNRLETTQRTRIKLGNILIDEVISIVGQEAYINNKQNLAKANKSKSAVNDYDTADVKIIKYVEKAYKRIHETAKNNDVTVPIRRHKSFDSIMAIIKAEETEEHKKRAEAWLHNITHGVTDIATFKEAYKQSCLDKGMKESDIKVPDMPTLDYAYSMVETDEENPDVEQLALKWLDSIKESLKALNDWKDAYKANMIEEGEEEESVVVPDMPTMEDAMNETYQLGVCDYISSFITYVNVQGYMNAIKSEKDAELVVNELVHQSYLWEYIDGIKGCGEITAAYILSDIDFRSTVHPSAVIRYLGMDNITTIHDREDKPVSEEQLPLIVKFLIHNYNLMRRREANNDSDDFGKLPPISEESFYRYQSELVCDYSEFLAIERVKDIAGLENKSYEEINSIDPEFGMLITKVWENANIILNDGPAGLNVPTIEKHARSKKDSVITTFLDKNGKINTKKSLGYNTKLKARIIEIMFGSMMKAKNEHYYGEIYLGMREREAQKYLARGLDPDVHKNHIHMKARRFAVQIFIEDLWMWVRRRLGYPTNGGTYYEAKLKGTHGYGLAQDSILNK